MILSNLIHLILVLNIHLVMPSIILNGIYFLSSFAQWIGCLNPKHCVYFIAFVGFFKWFFFLLLCESKKNKSQNKYSTEHIYFLMQKKNTTDAHRSKSKHKRVCGGKLVKMKTFELSHSHWTSHFWLMNDIVRVHLADKCYWIDNCTLDKCMHNFIVFIL